MRLIAAVIDSVCKHNEAIPPDENTVLPPEDTHSVTTVELPTEGPIQSIDQDENHSKSALEDAAVQEVVDGKSETREMIVDSLSGLALVGTYAVNEFRVTTERCAIQNPAKVLYNRSP